MCTIWGRHRNTKQKLNSRSLSELHTCVAGSPWHKEAVFPTKRSPASRTKGKGGFRKHGDVLFNHKAAKGSKAAEKKYIQTQQTECLGAADPGFTHGERERYKGIELFPNQMGCSTKKENQTLPNYKSELEAMRSKREIQRVWGGGGHDLIS